MDGGILGNRAPTTGGNKPEDSLDPIFSKTRKLQIGDERVLLTLKTLVVSKLLHYLKVLLRVERFEASGAEHEMRDTVYSIAVKEYLRVLVSNCQAKYKAEIGGNAHKHRRFSCQPLHTWKQKSSPAH